MSVKDLVEGGGNSKALKSDCRRGFREFTEKSALTGRMPGIVACGSRNDAFDDFKTALANGNDIVLLLVDAEGPVASPAASPKPWQHLKERDSWNRPTAATDNQCHPMVQTMESWFLADVDALESFYGKGFQKSSLTQNPRIERVSKQDVESGLKQATRNTSKGEYHKGRHSFEILAELDPAEVRRSSPYADRFLSELERQS